MTTLQEWREEFLAEYDNLDRVPLAETLQHSRDEALRTIGVPAAPSTEERIPPRYSAALAENVAVLDWMADLTRRALEGRRVVVAVTTGPSLLLLGATGTGKTHEAWGIVRGLAAIGVRSKWRVTAAADFYARLRPRHGIDSEAVFEDYVSASLLVVDDLGAVKNSEWIEEVNFRLVNHRYERMLPTVFTSNLVPAELASALGERVASRLKEMTRRVTLKGTDKRYAA